MNSNTRQINQFVSNQFAWTLFYMEFANKLLLHKNNRPQLLGMIKDVFDSLSLRYPFIEKDGTPLYDICPFTVFGCFNKGISNESRIAIMKGISNKLNVTAEVPTVFDGIPVLMPMRAWFFVGKNKRKADDIPNLWKVFEAGINFADNPSEVSKTAFVNCYEKVRKQPGIKWNLTIGLYWIRPFSYLNLDELNRRYLAQEKSPYYNIITRISNLKQLPSAKTYLELISACKEFFAKHDSPHRSFPELSHAVWTQMTLGGQPPEARDGGKTGKPGWIFQGNPKYYDVIGAVKNLDIISWDVKQYRNQIKKDDRAYIWVSGPGGGIVASGVVLCDPEVREYSKPDSYDLSGSFTTGVHNEVDIKLTNKIIDSIIKKEVFLADERLKKVSIINFANATNFKLTPEQADVIDSIINGTYSSQGPEIQGKDSAPSSRHWIYTPGNGSSKWDEFYSEGIMGIGWGEMGDLKQVPQ